MAAYISAERVKANVGCDATPALCGALPSSLDADQGRTAVVARNTIAECFDRTQMMNRLMLTLFPMVATTLAGVGVVIALTLGQDTLRPILIAAAAGGVISIPISWIIAQRLG
jgi:hypothetical protein